MWKVIGKLNKPQCYVTKTHAQACPACLEKLCPHWGQVLFTLSHLLLYQSQAHTGNSALAAGSCLSPHGLGAEEIALTPQGRSRQAGRRSAQGLFERQCRAGRTKACTELGAAEWFQVEDAEGLCLQVQVADLGRHMVSRPLPAPLQFPLQLVEFMWPNLKLMYVTSVAMDTRVGVSPPFLWNYRTHTHTHIYMYVCIHTHTYTHTHVYSLCPWFQA